MAFKVPEKFRVKTGGLASSESYGNNGLFLVKSMNLTRALTVIASDGEQWVDIEGYEEFYKISTHGRILAKRRVVEIPNNAKRVQEENIISLEKTHNGYYRASLCVDGKIDKILVSVLVANAFIKNKNNFPEVNHISGIKSDNFVGNLEWCTKKYNIHHAIENDLRKGIKKKDIEEIITLINEGLTPSEIALMLNKSRQTVSDIKFGRHRNLSPDLPVKYAGYDFWEHASVSLQDRTPTWNEMSFIKGLFWGEDDLVVQFHPIKSEYINNHEHCLHLWRKKDTNDFCERPDSIFIGIKT